MIAVRHAVDQRDLGPCTDAIDIGQLIRIFIMLIMREPHGVGADRIDHGHIFFLVFLRDGISLFCTVLMLVHAAQRIRAAVQEEALIFIHVIEPETDLLVDDILDAAFRIIEIHFYIIEIWVVDTIPQMRIGYAQCLIDRNDILAAFDAHALTSADLVPLIIIDKRLQISSVVGIQHDARVDIDLSAIRKHFLWRRCPGHIRDACLRDEDTFAAMIIQIKMRVIDRDQVHIAVQAAKDRKVTGQRHQ